jgi:hypothetical protein
VVALRLFMGWMRAEPRIIGMNPFHFGVVGFRNGTDTYEVAADGEVILTAPCISCMENH